MKAWRFALGLVLTLGLAASGLAQEAGVSFTAGGFFANEGVYRDIYGMSMPLTVELWLKTKGAFGLAAGYSWLTDDGLALTQGGGDAEYPVELRRTTIPLIAFYELDFKSVRIRAGAGVGVHSYEEVWLTSEPEFKDHKVSPRFVVSASARLIGRLSLVGTFIFENIPTGAGSVLASEVNLGGFQLLGGLSYRIF